MPISSRHSQNRLIRKDGSLVERPVTRRGPRAVELATVRQRLTPYTR